MDRKSNNACFLLFLIVPAIVLFPFFAFTGYAKTLTLGWNPNSEPDVEGYVIYRNPNSSGPPYKYDDTLPENDLTDPLHPMVTLTGLNEKTKYYIAVTAYDTDGNESYFSNEVCVEILDSTINNRTASAGSGSRSSSSGGAGGGCFISSTASDLNYFVFIFSVSFTLLMVAGCRRLFQYISN
jgi:hypothetical protein